LSDRAIDLANQLESAAAEVADVAASLSEAQWTAICPADGRQNNVMIDHISTTFAQVTPLAEMIIAGQDLPEITMDMVHAGNSAHASEQTGAARADVLASLKANASAAAATIRTWSDTDLDMSRPFALSPSGSISVAGMVQGILIDHAKHHLADLTAGLPE